ncbi:hypothetical protein HPB49_011922 [Dermacentor silvarum]|uniref:Uncharacterized protein n=1 Tax=Dermacentor silvarum TaxID=543639 RepID=A0ACB8D5A6_DERSI|nr:hypothetical protein HPB49_011922 [Dermacentor silvarum]
MDEEAAMELLQDQLEEKNLTPVHVVRRHVSPQTIIMRLGTKLNLAKYPTYQVTNAIGVAAGLTASEVRDVNIQVRQLQNLVAATSGRESATQKLAGLRSMTLDGERHDVTAYVAAEAQHARCVVHGLPKDIPDDQLLSIISIADRHILAARRLGQSEPILLTVKGATVPKEVKMGLWLTKTQPFRPRAVQCTICFTIGHRADVCPTAHEFTRCETCGQQFPPAQQPDQTAHECEVRCFNCEGPHGARGPRCPKKQQADKLTRLAAERRRLKTTSKDSGKPKNRQTSQSIATNPPKKNDQNYPSLPLHNRFEALRDTTPDPKSEARPRSGSLPGYPTKRSTPPPPPPKPKTPSFVRALLSQKPPAHSEEPPQKQPRHSSPEKVSPSFTPLGRSVSKLHNTTTPSTTSTPSCAGLQESAPPGYFLAYKAETDARLETIERQLNLLQKQQVEMQTQQAEILKQLAALVQSVELLRTAASTRRRGTARDEAHPYKQVNTNNGNVE